MTKLWNSRVWWLAGVLALSPSLFAETTTVQPFQTQITLSDPCAVFADPLSANVTRIVYGEPITFTVTGQVLTILNTGVTYNPQDQQGQDEQGLNLKFQINAHGDGVGAISGIKYLFNAKEILKAKTGDNLAAFSGSFRIDARIIGQGNAASIGKIAQGAQDNAILHFSMNIRYAAGQTMVTASQFSLECAASPWTNLMDAPSASTKVAVGRGFGDPWNKYAWSAKDFNGGLVVGTKSAFYNYASVNSPSDAVQACMTGLANYFPSIYLEIGCLELVGGPQDVGTHRADIWRYDYVNKNWTQMLHDPLSQGFRIMETHNGKLYVGSDLGSFITGVELYTGTLGPPSVWNFPGSQLLVSTDGKTFANVPCAPAPGTPGPCNSGTGSMIPMPPDVNTSFRALASYNGKLYLGTFNPVGSELWSYDQTAWTQVKKWGPEKPAIAELRVYNDKLYIGFAGTSDYLYTYDKDGALAAVASLPGDVPSTSLGVLKLFVAKGLLYVGNLDLTNGFNLHTYNGSAWQTITTNGFYNSNNAYAWSMAAVGNRVFVGTFNQDFLAELPRGSAELWFSDDNVNWQQAPLPVNWGPWNYGIRTMELGDKGKTLFFGTASNMIAPDLIMNPIPLSPGLEVWSMQATAAVKQ